MLFGHEREPTTSLTAARAIVVAGAFTGGGARRISSDRDAYQHEREPAWSHGSHFVQAEFQLPDWSRRGF